MNGGLPKFLALDWNGTVVPWFGMPPFAGAIEFVEQLRQAGVRICVVSHAEPAHIQGDVNRVGLTADEVIGTGNKRSEFARLQREWGSGLAIGDTPMDMRAAVAADIPFVQARLEGQTLLEHAHGCITSWDEAVLILKSMAGLYAHS